MVTRRLFTRLIDDAALFPPGNAAMAMAVQEHQQHERSWYADVVGPFLCPDARLGELAQAVRARPQRAGPLAVGVIVTHGPAALAAAARQLAPDEQLQLVAVEIPADRADPGASVVDIVAAADDAGVLSLPIHVEVPRGEEMEAAIAALQRHDLRAKLRMGGETAAAFPDEAEVAAFILQCLHHGVRFKFTAGLHDAVRHTATDSGFEHHGFLNLIIAVRIALEGGGPAAVAAALAERDEGELVHRIGRLDDVTATGVRGWLTSYGSCSIDEPVGELVRLGLLAAPPPPSPRSP